MNYGSKNPLSGLHNILSILLYKFKNREKWNPNWENNKGRKLTITHSEFSSIFFYWQLYNGSDQQNYFSTKRHMPEDTLVVKCHWIQSSRIQIHVL